MGGGGGDHGDRPRLPDPSRPGEPPGGLGADQGRDRRRGRRPGRAPRRLDHPYYLGLLGDALAATAGPGQGLAVIDEAIELVGTARPFYYLPELHRLRGDLLARDGRRVGQAAEAYGRAMEIAAGHGSRSAELRAAIRLCRLPPRSRPTEANAHLRRLYDQFEEGFGTPDLLAARALLDAG